jgi:hypothetical protein
MVPATPHSVVEARLEEVDPIGTDQVDNSVLLCEAPRPGAWGKVLERLRLTDALERIAEDGLDQVERA